MRVDFRMLLTADQQAALVRVAGALAERVKVEKDARYEFIKQCQQSSASGHPAAQGSVTKA